MLVKLYELSGIYLCFKSSEAAERLFDLVDSFAESAKRKAAVWPLQIILLILCPEITLTISKETVEDSKANKVG
jgi:neurofibromin 1